MNQRITTYDSGREGERLAAEWLTESGFNIIDRNWRTRSHEIDIVATYGQTLHFVEVKYRRSRHFGSPVEYVNFDKQRRIKAAAFAYIHERRPYFSSMQVDLIGVYGFSKPFKLQYLPNITGH